MLSPCFSDMSAERFNTLPSSTNAVESHNRFSKAEHPESLKLAMFATYKVDMAKTLEVMAKCQGLTTTYENQLPGGSEKRSRQQSEARKKRRRDGDKGDDADGPPDTKRKFQEETPKRLTRSTQMKMKGNIFMR